MNVTNGDGLFCTVEQFDCITGRTKPAGGNTSLAKPLMPLVMFWGQPLPLCASQH